jgi:hypothetical protein
MVICLWVVFAVAWIAAVDAIIGWLIEVWSGER